MTMSFENESLPSFETYTDQSLEYLPESLSQVCLL